MWELEHLIPGLPACTGLHRGGSGNSGRRAAAHQTPKTTVELQKGGWRVLDEACGCEGHLLEVWGQFKPPLKMDLWKQG